MTARLATICILGWTFAAALALFIGPWSAFGVASLLLGFVVWLRARPILELSARDLATGALAGLAMTAMTQVLFALVAPRLPSLLVDAAGLYDVFRVMPPAGRLLLLVPIVVGEELVWRGAVQTALTGWLRTWPAALACALLYAAAQLPLGSPVLALVALGGGLVWSGLRAGTGRLGAPLVAHLVWDAIVLVLRPLA